MRSDGKGGSVIWLSRASTADSAIVGGKASGLIQLMSQVKVPDGFVIPCTVVDALLEPPKKRFAAKPDLGNEETEEEDKESTESGEMAISANLKDEIRAAALKLGAESFAVRSSAANEDSAHASYAGQYRTLLNVCPHNLVGALVTCANSLFGPHLDQYESLNRAIPPQAGMAILVQEMVEAVHSGVMFTVDPVSHRLDQVVIESTMGLGAPLVNGEIVPAFYRLDKFSGEILEHSAPLCSEDAETLTTGGQGTQDSYSIGVDVGALSRKMVQELLSAALSIETVFGFPQDIEWAFDPAGRLNVLQSRPVTALAPQREEFSIMEECAFL